LYWTRTSDGDGGSYYGDSGYGTGSGIITQHQIFNWSGDWPGGYVEGMGYVPPDTIIYGGSGNYNDSGYSSGSNYNGDSGSYLSGFNIAFSGSTANSATMSTYTMNLLYDIMESANNYNITITSTTRTPYDQARIMYENIIAHGVQSQLEIYLPPGERVIGVYNPNLSREQNISNMQYKIISEGPTNVSKHCADPSQLNVFDVALSSINNQAAFENTLNAYSISFLKENGCYHIQIPQ